VHILLKQFGTAPDTFIADMPTQTDTPTADTLIADTPTAEFEPLNSVKMAAQMIKTLRVHHICISRH